MKVAVVTPYYKESLEIIKRCHDSVLSQTHNDVFHVIVSDGFAHPEIDEWENVIHIKGPHHNDYGDTPKAIGALSAANQGADAITLLDADNWFEPDHIETLYELQKKTGAQVVTGTRWLYRLDGTRMSICNESNGRDFNDSNCYLLMKPTFSSLMSWGFKNPKDCIVGDRVFWDTVKRMGYSRAHCMTPTVNYVTAFACHYQANGERPPVGAKVIVRFEGQQYSQMISFEEYERFINGLRSSATV